MLHLFLLAGLALPSWNELESKLPTVQPPVFDSLPANVDGKPVLFRDKEGLSPYAQQIWLALELKGVDFITVLTDEESPRLEWPDGTTQTDSLEILERIQQEYSDLPPDLYKRVSKAVDNVRCNIVRFEGVFPRKTDDSLHAPFIFRDGELVPISSHMVSLEETDEVLEEYYDGPFLCGDFISAADIVWAPFLERYAAQLPMTHDGDALEPRYGGRYDALVDWFNAMESVPCYSCSVAGDRATWEAVLTEAVDNGLVPKVDLLPPRGKRVPTNRRRFDATAVWKEYAKSRPYLCSTPEEECVAFVVRNKDSIMETAGKALALTTAEVDEGLREMVGSLLESSDAMKLSGNARDIAALIDDGLRVPRDMAMLPAATLRSLVAAAPKPRIKG